MKVLLVGKGGRESALAWGLARSSDTEVFCAPGNPGIASFAEIVDVAAEDIRGQVDVAVQRRVDLVVVGPEAPLVAGLADALLDKGIPVFGPQSAGAKLEGSKSWAKDLMVRHGIPTASARRFTSSREAITFAEELGGRVVVKADGLAEGKGVTVANDLERASDAIREALDDRRFGEAGKEILLEETLVGEELSMLMLFDGSRFVPLAPAQDYKRIGDDNAGPNTGGMGSYSPVPVCTPEIYQQILDQILEPTARALIDERIPYRGIVYAGVMLTEDGPKVFEYNCRFGDPETQALIPRLQSDLTQLLHACAVGNLGDLKPEWTDDACVSVVAASSGYPGSYRTGLELHGLKDAEAITGIPVFHAGTRVENGRLVTAGGRVLAVSALGSDHEAARRLAYRGLSRISFDGIYYRTDIASWKERTP